MLPRFCIVIQFWVSPLTQALAVNSPPPVLVAVIGDTGQGSLASLIAPNFHPTRPSASSNEMISPKWAMRLGAPRARLHYSLG